MSYNVYHTDGALLTTVNDGSLNTVTSISLIGVGYANYSETISESFVHLMENFAGSVSPLAPQVGQLWWDKTNGHLNVYDGTKFKSINPTTISSIEPSDAVNGDFWFDIVNLQLKTYISPTWVPVSPIYSVSQGISGPVVSTIVDTSSNYHTITSLYNANNIVAVMSSDNSFIPFSLPGIWNSINPGINLGYGYEITGTTSTARQALGLVADVDANYMHANTNTSTVGTLSAPTILGATIGNTGTTFTGSTINLTGAITTTTSVNATNINAINIGYANTAYSGSTINISGQINISNNLISAPTINAGTIGNSGATLTGATLTTTSDITTSGNVVVATAPTSGNHAANKTYVDSAVFAAQLPVGTVIMWYGSLGSLPTGYQLCDGTNSTPDLRDRFVYGAGGNVSLGVTGGNNYNTLSTTAAGGHSHTANTGIGGAHTHTITDSTSGYTLDITQIPAHRHVAPYSDNVDVGLPTVPGTYGSAGAGPTDYDQYKSYTGLSGGSGGDNLNVGGTTLPHAHNLSVTTSGVDGTHYHAFSTDTVAAHTHTVAFDNTPSWTALYYIMRIA
jgi:hypothetical protein